MIRFKDLRIGEKFYYLGVTFTKETEFKANCPRVGTITIDQYEKVEKLMEFGDNSKQTFWQALKSLFSKAD